MEIELSNEITGRLVASMNKNKKFHCDSCGNFTENKDYQFYRKGTCSLTNSDIFALGWCKSHTTLISSRKRWLLTIIEECPVCGKSEKIIKHIKDRPKPTNIHERFIYEQKYDHCLE